MAGLPEVIGLLYRADWTRLSLSAELRSETDREPLPRLPRERWYRAWPGQRQDDGRYVGRGTLLIGPGGRWRLECSVPGRGAEGQAAEGNDGERGWSWRPPEAGGPPPLPVGLSAAYPPPPELFCPSCLLGGYTLEELGPVTVAGRDAIAVAATPRRDALSSVPGRRFPDRISHDRIEVAADPELGILLRRIETSGGELVTVTELTDLTMNPPEAAGLARFAPPPGSNRSESPAAGPPKWPTGPVGKNAVGLAAGGLGALIRYAPHRPGHGPAGQDPAAMMPSPDPAPLGPGDDISPPDEVLDLLYRGGEPRDLGATVRQWDDLAAMNERAFEEVRAAGPGGVGYFLDAVARWQTVTRQLRVTPVPGREELVLGPLMTFPADAIVDAETGCLLRLIYYAGDTLARWWELDDISTEPADPDEFRVHVPPGTRTVEETGNLVVDAFATMPGLTGTAVRAAAETANRTAAAVSAARSFLDDLRGHR